MIEYRIQPYSPEAHLFRVHMRVEIPCADGQIFALPAWIAGSYMIRDFAKHLVTLAANSNGKPVPVSKLDKHTWRCEPVGGPLELVYEVYAWDLSVRAAHLDTTHAYFNGTSVFLRAQGFEHSACGVEIEPPRGEAYAAWRVATTLPVEDAEPFAFGRYRAENYDELVDHPVEMGVFTQAGFTAGSVSHEVVISGRHQADMDRLCRDLAPICEQHIGLFGDLPVQRYLFMVLAVGEGYGGLEHRSSTSLLCKRDDLPRKGEEKISNGYRRFLSLCSHEYFHLWNVKRIRPQAFVDGGLETEVYTRQLWVFEGITSYYDELALLRCGCIETESYLELLAQAITGLTRSSGRLKQSLADSSFDAWTKFYKQDENAPNAIVSYYTKGALVALALDLTLRLRTNGNCSLDHLMHELWLRYGKTGNGVAEGEVERLASEVSGVDLNLFFEKAIRSTAGLPLQALLGDFGIGLRMRPARDSADKGGLAKSDKEGQESAAIPVLGARYPVTGQEARLSHVYDGGAAQEAGLSAGDIIVAVGGIRAQPHNLERLISQVPPGTTVTAHVFRRDELMRFTVKPKPAPTDTCELRLINDCTSEIQARRKAWLNGATSSW